MPFYLSKGQIPQKKHTLFKYKNNLCYEELVSREGFSGIYSNLYHLNMPTAVNKVGKFIEIKLHSSNKKHKARHIKTFNVKEFGNAVDSRMPLFYNDDLIISICHINENMNFLYRSGYYDELMYVQYGSGIIKTNFGDLAYVEGDYIIIPRGVIWSLKNKTKTKMLIVESVRPIEIPRKYKNKFGQLIEGSPYCERDIKTPLFNKVNQSKGNHVIKVRLKDGIQEYVYNNHPFDLIGWDGYYYPWIFNIKDFEPIVGSIHQPPPVHQTFSSKKFVVCSFVPRPFDFHDKSIPAPYPHSNVDSDEFIFYSKGDFMSRKGISKESVTVHPMGLPHGPQPGKYEDSIGQKKTEELAVMIDTFRPLLITDYALNLQDSNYSLSWNK